MRLYSVAPGGAGPALADAARRADRAGLDGMLIDADNGGLEPWSVAQYVIERTERLAPLVTVQPWHMHPYMTARLVSAIASMLGRRVDLNLVTGDASPDARALGCGLRHDESCERLRDYGRIVTALLRAEDTVTVDGPHYRMTEAVIYPTMSPRLAPRIFVGGHPPASVTVARDLRVGQLIDLPEPDDLAARPPRARSAVRVGIIARDTAEQAGRVARQRAPRAGLLVGSHAEVAEALVPWRRAGVAAVVTDVAETEEDLNHAMTVMRLTGS